LPRAPASQAAGSPSPVGRLTKPSLRLNSNSIAKVKRPCLSTSTAKRNLAKEHFAKARDFSLHSKCLYMTDPKKLLKNDCFIPWPTFFFCHLDRRERSRLYMTHLRRQGFAVCIMLRLVEQWNKQHWGQSLSSHIRAEAGDRPSYLVLSWEDGVLERRRGASGAKPAGREVLLATEVMNTLSGLRATRGRQGLRNAGAAR